MAIPTSRDHANAHRRDSKVKDARLTFTLTDETRVDVDVAPLRLRPFSVKKNDFILCEYSGILHVNHVKEHEHMIGLVDFSGHEHLYWRQHLVDVLRPTDMKFDVIKTILELSDEDVEIHGV